MSDEKKRDDEEFGFEIENDSEAQEPKDEGEGISREEAADLLKNFNAIFDDDEDS